MTVIYENKLQPFFRVSWTSAQAASIWAPRIARIRTMLGRQRRHLIEKGVIGYYQDSLFAHQEDRLIKQLEEVDLDYTSLHNNHYTLHNLIHHSKLEDQAKHTYFAGKKATIHLIKESILSNSKEALFALSGMATCCAKTYQSFLESGYHDPLTWLAVNRKRFPMKTMYKAGRFMLGQAFEMPLIPLFACDPECDHAEAHWQNIIKHLKQVVPDPTNWLEEILDWPMHWSALHGCAELKTPVAKIIYRCDATSDKQEIRFEGNTYPEEGERGLAFPYRNEM